MMIMLTSARMITCRCECIWRHRSRGWRPQGEDDSCAQSRPPATLSPGELVALNEKLFCHLPFFAPLIDTTFTITTSTWLLAIVIAAADVKPAMTGTDMKSIKNPSLVIKKDDCGQSDGDCGLGEVGWGIEGWTWAFRTRGWSTRRGRQVVLRSLVHTGTLTNMMEMVLLIWTCAWTPVMSAMIAVGPIVMSFVLRRVCHYRLYVNICKKVVI